MKRWIVALLCLLAGASSQAHVFEITDVDVRFDGRRYSIDVQVDVDALALGVSPATDSAEVVAVLSTWTEERQQAALDLDTLERAIGRSLSTEERERFLELEHQALRWTFLGTGMTHPNVLQTLDAISPTGRSTVDGVSGTFC